MTGITYGLLPEGFIVEPFEAVRAEIATQIRARFGTSINTGDTGVLGQLAAITALAVAAVWEQTQQVYAAGDPDKATGDALDALCALTGTFRAAATASRVTLTLTGTPTSLIPAGTLVATVSTSQSFATTTDVTLAAVALWAATTAYAIGDRVTKGSRVYQCVHAGTSAGSGGPTGTGLGIVDSGVIWDYVGEGTAAADVASLCTITGVILAIARDVKNIKTAVGGLSSAINLLDALPGRDEMTDGQLRVLREQELASAGTGTIDAIVAALLKGLEPDVLSVAVFENVTDTTDVDGVPPHTVEALVDIDASFNQKVGDLLLANVAAGINTYGSGGGAVTVTSTDSQGTAHTIHFSHPTEVPIVVDITVKYDAAKYPADGDQQIKNLIAAQTRVIGRDAAASAIGAIAFKVAGVLDVPRSGSLGGCLIKTPSGTPTSDATIVINKRSVATFQTADVTVHSSAITP